MTVGIVRRKLPVILNKHPLAFVDVNDVRKHFVYSLEVNAVDHCNLRCRQCAHMSPAYQEAFRTPEQLSRVLGRTAEAVYANTLSVLGGEPLLHPNLAEVLDACRASGISRHIYVTTNGVLAREQPKSLWKHMDFVVISVHGGGLSLEEARALADELSPHVIARVVKDTFRQIFLPDALSDDDTDYVWRTCEQAHEMRCHFVHAGKYYRCPPQRFIHERLADATGAQIQDDGLDLSGPNLFDRLTRYLQRTDALEACRYCLGSSGGRILRHDTLKGQPWRLFE